MKTRITVSPQNRTELSLAVEFGYLARMLANHGDIGINAPVSIEIDEAGIVVKDTAGNLLGHITPRKSPSQTNR